MSKDTSLSKKMIFIFCGEQKIQRSNGLKLKKLPPLFVENTQHYISIGQIWHHIFEHRQKYGKNMEANMEGLSFEMMGLTAVTHDMSQNQKKMRWKIQRKKVVLIDAGSFLCFSDNRYYDVVRKFAHFLNSFPSPFRHRARLTRTPPLRTLESAPLPESVR
jgi:hypothetical protein